MKDILMYKEYVGSVHFSSEDEVFFGKIEGINDLITFEGETVKQVKQAFEESIDAYISLCKAENKTHFKSYMGSFNVRINPELHRKAVNSAVQSGMSLNQFVQKAIEDEVEGMLRHG